MTEPRSTVTVRQVITIHKVVRGMWASSGFAEDAGQEGAASRLALTTTGVSLRCGTANAHSFGIFNAT